MSDRPTLLVVDDDEPNRDLVRRAFREVYDGLEAGDAENALVIVESGKKVDVIICDQMMPGTKGTVFLQELRRRGVRIPAILVTAFEHLSAIDEARRAADIVAVLDKPLVLGELKKAIEAALTRATSP